MLGVDVAAIQISGTIAQMESWIAERRRWHFIAVTGMHGVMEAQRDAAFNRALKAADLVVPDGMPLGSLGCAAIRYGVACTDPSL